MEVGAEVVLIYDVSVSHLLLKTWRFVRFRCLTALGLDKYGRGSHSSKVGTFFKPCFLCCHGYASAQKAHFLLKNASPTDSCARLEDVWKHRCAFP